MTLSPFKLALNTSTIRACDLGVLDEVGVAAQAGYLGVELWAAEIDAFLDQGGKLDDIRQAAADQDISILNLIAFPNWAHPDDAVRTAGLAHARRLLGTAAELGCPYVAAPPAGIARRDDISLDEIADRYGALLEVGREEGALPLLEFWGHSKVLGSLAEALVVLHMVDQPHVALLADVFHMAKSGGVFELLNTLDPSQLGLFHVNDYPSFPHFSVLTDKDRIYPGDGVAPYGLILGALGSIGYCGYLSLELFNQIYQAEGPVAVAETGLRKLRSVLATST